MNNSQVMRGRMNDPYPRPQPPPSCCCPKPSRCPRPVACGLSELPLGMAYVPMQVWGTTYTPEQALCRGTLFPQLDLPWGGCR